MFDLKLVASVLDSEMRRSGIFDDYDEILNDLMCNEGISGVHEFHKGVMESIRFLNEYMYDENSQCDPQGLQDIFESYLY